MSELKMIAPAVPNVPWQDKPEGHKCGDIRRILLLTATRLRMLREYLTVR